MVDWIRRALTRRMSRKGLRGRQEEFIIVPDERLVYAVKFTVGMSVCLSALEIAHMAFLGRWNSEVFAALSGLIGMISGILIGQRA
jgi:hypothetical protein